MTTQEVAKALEEWAADAASLNSSFDTPPEFLSQAFPLVIAEVKRKQRGLDGDTPPELKSRMYQQVTLRLWTAELMILVSPDPAWTASHSLYDLVDSLEESLYKDASLGGRVDFARQEIDANFDPPEVEFSDGSVARQVVFNMVVGEQMGVSA